MGGDELKLKGSFHATFSPASNKLITGRFMFDTGIILTHVHQQQESGGSSQRKNEDSCNEVAAADDAAASKAAGDILDSLQMPHMVAFKNNNSNVNVVPASCSGSSSGDSSDESSNDRGGAFSNSEL
jgi:hypothetical protein